MLYVDENNEPITEVDEQPDWSIWRCEWVEESDEYDVIQHCRKYTQAELDQTAENKRKGDFYNDLEKTIAELKLKEALS